MNTFDEAGFTNFLSTRLGRASIRSYLSNLRRVQRVLGVDLALQDLSPTGIEGIQSRLLKKGGGEFASGSLADSMTALRRYAEFCGHADPAPEKVVRIKPAARERSVVPERSFLVSNSTVRELLSLYGEVLDELRAREIVRTGNGPVGDYAEHLFAFAFGWTLEANSSSGHDAVGGNTRYQIKARRVTARNRSRQLGAIRRLPEQTFDVLAAVIFDELFRVQRAILIPHSEVLARAKRVEHTNSWRLVLDDGWWEVPGVDDVTVDLRAAQEAADQQPVV